MNYVFTQRSQVASADPDRLSDQCGRVMGELVDMGVADPTVGATLSKGEVEISVMVDADSYPAAVQKAMAVIRSAIHAADGGTPNWPKLNEAAVRSIEVEAAEADEVPLGV